MKNTLKNAWRSLPGLFKFLFWYGAIVAALFYLAPLAGLYLEHQYEAMSGTARFVSVLVLLVVIGAWKIAAKHE